jgi:hypothetical protein
MESPRDRAIEGLETGFESGRNRFERFRIGHKRPINLSVQHTTQATKRRCTDVAAAAFLASAALDIAASIGRTEGWAIYAFRAAMFGFIGGVMLIVVAAITGQIRRAQTLSIVTISVTAIVDVALRVPLYNTHVAPSIEVLALSIVLANLVALSAAFGDVFGDLLAADDAPHGLARSSTSSPSWRRGKDRRYVVLRGADGLWASWQGELRQRAN